MVEEVVFQLFSARCSLKSLQLEHVHGKSDGSIYRRSAVSSSSPHCNSILYERQSSCLTLRRLYIRLTEILFIENLVERLPNLEEMLVECPLPLGFNSLRVLNLPTLRKSNENWFNKVNEISFISVDKNCVFLDAKITIF